MTAAWMDSGGQVTDLVIDAAAKRPVGDANEDSTKTPMQQQSVMPAEFPHAATPLAAPAWLELEPDWSVHVLQLPLLAGAADLDNAAMPVMVPAMVPVVVIDHFYPDVEGLRHAACQHAGEFVRDANNFYPGARCQAPHTYQQFLSKLQLLLRHVYGNTPWGRGGAHQVQQAAFALTCTPPTQLRPIQMLPHFDTVSPNTLALVHYLAGPEQGGTSFYRHRSSGLCCITEQTLPHYGAELKQQAIAARLHENPSYQAGDSALFQRIGQVTAAVNRVAIYPAHLLHSGDILQAENLSADPRLGRLTVSCLLQQ